MSTLPESESQLSEAWNNLDRLPFDKSVGNLALIGTSPDGTGYTMLCALVGDATKPSLQLEIAPIERGDGMQVQAVPTKSAERKFKAYPILASVSPTPAKNRWLHLLTSGSRGWGIIHTIIPPASVADRHWNLFGEGDHVYRPSDDTHDPTPWVHGMIDVAYSTKTEYNTRERHANGALAVRDRNTRGGGLVTRSAYIFNVPSNTRPGVALAVTSHDRTTGRPDLFQGLPFALPINFASLEETVDYYWSLLPEKQRVAIGAVAIRGDEREYVIINAE